jgi:hypothetical protein
VKNTEIITFWSKFPVSAMESLPHAGVQTSSRIHESDRPMTRHRLQFFRTATRNIDPAAQVTRLMGRGETIAKHWTADVVLIFGGILAIQVLVIKYP